MLPGVFSSTATSTSAVRVNITGDAPERVHEPECGLGGGFHSCQAFAQAPQTGPSDASTAGLTHKFRGRANSFDALGFMQQLGFELKPNEGEE